MAANHCLEEIPAIVDRSCDLPVDGSCFQLVKPSFDEVNQQCTLDVLPLLFEEASFPMEEKCGFQTAHLTTTMAKALEFPSLDVSTLVLAAA